MWTTGPVGVDKEARQLWTERPRGVDTRAPQVWTCAVAKNPLRQHFQSQPEYIEHYLGTPQVLTIPLIRLRIRSIESKPQNPEPVPSWSEVWRSEGED